MLPTKAKMRIARMLNIAIIGVRSLAGRTPFVRVRRFGVNWRLDLNEGIDLALYLGTYQNIPPRIMERWLPPGSLAVDIGANIGAHCLRIARRIGANGRVVAVEPTDYAFAKLTANAQLNPDLLGRLVLVQAALTEGPDRCDTTQFYARWPLRTEGTARHARHLGQFESARNARFEPLDALLDELRNGGRITGPVAFIKLDVDGHELEVLRGARRTLTKEKPVMMVEISPHQQDEVPQRFENFLRILVDFGYRLEDQNSGHSLPMSAAELRNIIRDGASIDAIARPL